jgi:NAD(P)-dependent dehydrogenase (short-subunit alcohol dehydrogenase family)
MRADAAEFAGKRVLVTGGTRGIGAAVVARLARGGAQVITTARTAAVAPRVADAPDQPQFVAADVSDGDGVAAVVEAVRRRLGGVDWLVSNVGGSSAPAGGFAALADADWQRALNANLLAAVRLDRALLPHMVERGAGAIVHISSIQRRLPLFEATLAYAAAKAALTTYTRASRTRSAPRACGSTP